VAVRRAHETIEVRPYARFAALVEAVARDAAQAFDAGLSAAGVSAEASSTATGGSALAGAAAAVCSLGRSTLIAVSLSYFGCTRASLINPAPIKAVPAIRNAATALLISMLSIRDP